MLQCTWLHCSPEAAEPLRGSCSRKISRITQRQPSELPLGTNHRSFLRSRSCRRILDQKRSDEVRYLHAEKTQRSKTSLCWSRTGVTLPPGDETTSDDTSVHSRVKSGLARPGEGSTETRGTDRRANVLPSRSTPSALVNKCPPAAFMTGPGCCKRVIAGCYKTSDNGRHVATTEID